MLAMTHIKIVEVVKFFDAFRKEFEIIFP